MTRNAVIQVNESKSGITEQEEFVVIYTLDDGRDTRPVTLDRLTAMEVAQKFRAERKGDRELKINAAAAQYILGAIEAAGWLEDSASENEVDDGELAPRYLPKIDAGIQPEVDEELFADLVFVLAGVNPKMRTDPETIAAGSSLYDQFRTPSSRISASDTMLRDHWYVTSHLHEATVDEFKRLWDMAKEQLGGEEATDYAKLGRLLGNVEIDEEGKMLSNPKNAPILFEIRDGAVGLLYRQFRTVRRKLDEIHASADAKPKPKKKGLLGAFRKQEPETSLFISDEAIKVTRRYLEVVVKLGRILRSELLTQTKTNEPHAESA